MIFDTKQFFRDNRDVQIHVEHHGVWKLYKTISPKREQRDVTVSTWFGFFTKKIQYMHPTETYEDTVDVAYDICLRKNSKTKIITKQIIWLDHKEQFAYSGDMLVWSREHGWVREY